MAANGGCHFEIIIHTENYKTQSISQKHAYIYTHLTTVIIAKYENNHLIGLFYEYCPYWKQVAQRAMIAHLSPMCQDQISFQKTYK